MAGWLSLVLYWYHYMPRGPGGQWTKCNSVFWLKIPSGRVVIKNGCRRRRRCHKHRLNKQFLVNFTSIYFSQKNDWIIQGKYKFKSLFLNWSSDKLQAFKLAPPARTVCCMKSIIEVKEVKRGLLYTHCNVQNWEFKNVSVLIYVNNFLEISVFY